MNNFFVKNTSSKFIIFGSKNIQMCEKNEFQLLVIKFALLLFCYKGHKFFYKGIDKSILS
jgi:hypothetical protein